MPYSSRSRDSLLSGNVRCKAHNSNRYLLLREAQFFEVLPNFSQLLKNILIDRLPVLFKRLANALSALYPKDSEEKRLLDAMLLAMPR